MFSERHFPRADMVMVFSWLREQRFERGSAMNGRCFPCWSLMHDVGKFSVLKVGLGVAGVGQVAYSNDVCTCIRVYRLVVILVTDKS